MKQSSTLQFLLRIQQNQFPQICAPHWPEFSPLEHPESLQSLFPMTAFQPLEDCKSCTPISPLFSKLNSPSSTLKIISLPYLSACLSPRNKSYFTSLGSSIFLAPRVHKERQICLPNPGLIPREIQFYLGFPRESPS